ncbi:glycosyltransferase family 2 protein [Lacunimicrobium album]
MVHLSCLVPVYNEHETLEELCRQIQAALKDQTINGQPIVYEIIMVDDGSRDGSWDIIQSLTANHPVRGIRFRRNFGKAAALLAAFRTAKGNVYVTLDADLQDDPNEIPKMLNKMGEGFDVVNGWKKDRRDPWHKVYPSWVFNGMIGKLSGLKLHDHNCGLKMFRREVAQEIRMYGELHRFIPIMAHGRGFKVTEIPVYHRPREFGVSKYGFNRFLKGFLDLLTVTFLTDYGRRPQHFLGGWGFFFFVLGGLGMVFLGLEWFLMNVMGFMKPVPIGSRPLLIYSIACLLLGGQGITLGFLAEMMVSFNIEDKDVYSVVDRTTPESTL